MDQHELAQELYYDNRIIYGDGDYAWNESWDEAGEIIGRENARQDDLDYRASGETVSILDNKWAPNPPEVPGVSGGIVIGALGALGSPVVIVGLGLLVGGYVLYKCLSNEDAQTLSDEDMSSTHTDSPAEILARHERLVSDLREDLNAHLEQPGSMFYMSTEFPVADLTGHFERFKDPKHIDMFIRGETRTKVLEMAELWKVAIA